MTSGAVRRWFAASLVGSVGVAMVTLARSSFLFRWFAAEPEPDVIVIDLEETIVLGPFVGALDTVVGTFRTERHRSAADECGSRLVKHLDESPVRAAGIVVLTATVTASAVPLADGSLTTDDLYLRLGIALIALLWLRSEASLDDLRATRAARVLRAILEPPEPGMGARDDGDSSSSSLESDE